MGRCETAAVRDLKQGRRWLSMTGECSEKIMHKINTNDLVEETWSSPKGKFVGAGKEISEALGRKPQSTDLSERHPFDVEICRIPPGQGCVSLSLT